MMKLIFLWRVFFSRSEMEENWQHDFWLLPIWSFNISYQSGPTFIFPVCIFLTLTNMHPSNQKGNGNKAIFCKHKVEKFHSTVAFGPFSVCFEFHNAQKKKYKLTRFQWIVKRSKKKKFRTPFCAQVPF